MTSRANERFTPKLALAQPARFSLPQVVSFANIRPTTVPANSYIIRGGVAGRERLRILSRVMRPTSLALLARAGLQAGMKVLEIGCGGGDLAFDIARIVGSAGRVLGTDIDQTKLDLAAREAAEHHLTNIDFQLADIAESAPPGNFDLVHTRFVLTHLAEPARALKHIRAPLRPGGIVVLEDIDFSGYFCYPDCAALWRYVQLYTETTRRRGVDANIGRRLPSLLAEAGFENIQVNVVQPAGLAREVKLISPLTMESIADAVVAEGLATAAEIERIVADLYDFANTPGTLGSTPRIFEAWATQPA
jgi:2-polyprenyl-3-methyl-5-hydroxy-6-metoxy-1,4-benzoquinol methylase